MCPENKNAFLSEPLTHPQTLRRPWGWGGTPFARSRDWMEAVPEVSLDGPSRGPGLAGGFAVIGDWHVHWAREPEGRNKDEEYAAFTVRAVSPQS